MTLEQMVEATPASRDRYMDLLRAFSICVVVFGHWLISTIQWHGGLMTTGSILSSPGIWIGTWVFQVMPIFFFVGGFSNLVAYRSHRGKGGSIPRFVRGRIERLLRPSLIFLGLWAAVQIVLHIADIGTPAGFRIWGDTRLLRGFLPPAQTLPFGPMWFLAVYLIVVTISPITIWLHNKLGWWVPIIMLVGSIVVDAFAFGNDLHTLRWANVPFMLLFPHQLGHLHADGRFSERQRKLCVGMVIVGLGALILLTNPWIWEAVAPQARFDWFPELGRYPRSLLGTGTEPISNAYPPTMPFMMESIWTIGVVMLLKPAASRWLQGKRPWMFTIAANSIVMTLFLWHMTAFLFAIFILWPLGFGREQTASIRWWLEKPLWLGVAAALLAGLVAVFGRFERPASGPRPARAGGTKL